jgi:hypothetical protein
MSDGACTEGKDRAGKSLLPMGWSKTKPVLLFDFPVAHLI